MRRISLILISLLAMLVAGCEQKGAAQGEKAGEAAGQGTQGKEMTLPVAADGPRPSKVDPELPPLRIALIPVENPERLVDNVKPTFAYLQEQLGRRITFRVTMDYSTAVEALRREQADVCFMSPLPYVLAHAQTGAVAVLKEVYAGRPYYYSKIFVRKDSGIEKLSDLKGKTIAYVDPISSSGYMYPHMIFSKAGLLGASKSPEGGFFKRVMFAGGDQQAIQALYHKHVDAAGVGEFSLDLLALDQRDAVKVIATSERIPSHCVVVRKGLDAGLRKRFVEAMLSLDQPAHKKLLANLYGTQGYRQADHADYQSVEKMAARFGLIKR